jgi:hypothetical protein
MSALEPIQATYSGQLKDERFGVSPSSVDHLRARSWNPEKEEVPLSARAAVTAARTSLKKMFGASEAYFGCREVALHRDNGDWHYVVMFESDHKSLIKEDKIGIYPAIIPFVVYLDGFVEVPFKKPN